MHVLKSRFKQKENLSLQLFSSPVRFQPDNSKTMLSLYKICIFTKVMNIPLISISSKSLAFINLLNGMGSPACVSAVFKMWGDICDFLFAYLGSKPFQNRELLLKERICFLGANSFI